MTYSVGLRVVHKKLGNGTIIYIKHRGGSPDLIAVRFDVVEKSEDTYADKRIAQKFLATTKQLKKLED